MTVFKKWPTEFSGSEQLAFVSEFKPWSLHTTPCQSQCLTERSPHAHSEKLINHLSLRAVVLCKKKQLLTHSGAASQSQSTILAPYLLLSEHFGTSGAGIERSRCKSHERRPMRDVPCPLSLSIIEKDGLEAGLNQWPSSTPKVADCRQ